ncbi:uncharacterized protein LOC133924817 isoform X2 [Phragmites australis]|uniref:uncharacterized protein LOC133924817 isoform X2 n=1 Tax=Phragmites australis TaxID=29695 RepID=UPI002D77DDDF|nr:uncharacterized protein LOC133924817 isoform X2 [Phragmites australis]
MLTMKALAAGGVEPGGGLGSSRNITMGSLMMSTPMDRRRRSPPDTPRCPSSPIMVLAALRRPSWSMSACTRFFFSLVGRERARRNSAANMSVSSTASIGHRRPSCMMYAKMTLSRLLSSDSPEMLSSGVFIRGTSGSGAMIQHINVTYMVKHRIY